MKTTIRFFTLLAVGLALSLWFLAAPRLHAADNFTLDTARAAAAKGDPEAEFFLARHYADGVGVQRDYSKAVAYLRKAAAQGYVPAQTGLGSCYAHGQGVKQDFAEAAHWYREAAAHGDALAQYCLGYAYAQGKGVPKDFDKAVQWWRKSADQGQVYAQNALGQFYFQGEHPGDTNHINYSEAVKWLRKAAEQDCAPAMGTLGYMYQYGVGVEHDWPQALRWNRRAAGLGDATAQDNLGQMYENGNAGLPADKVQAYKWFLLSDEQGSGLGRHDVIEFELHHVLTPEQTAEAQRMAAEFHAQMSTNPPAASPERQIESAR
ncbi:MAG TPA: tetratricopeptide repeat protein [Candidatus Saccharimonadales bacterium]|nr:tetratricopeptide repeat protein [Candidatus Saccharimonadales bacterium]